MTDSTQVEQALALFSTQFRESEKVNDFMRCFLRPLDEVKTVHEDLKQNRWLDTSEGQQLDEIGAIVGEERQGRTDDKYREAIRFRIFINLSKTEPETMIKAVKVLTDATFVRYWEHGNGAGFQLFTNGPNVFTEVEAAFELVYLELTGGDLLELSGGDHLVLKSVFNEAFALMRFLRSIKAAGVDYVSLSYSLGRTPIFGFGYEFESARLSLGGDDLLEVDDGDETGNLELRTNRRPETSPDGFEGFAEVSPAQIILSNGKVLTVNYGGEDVPLSADYVGLTVGGGKLVEGTRDYG